jgi:hypothetical protein
MPLLVGVLVNLLQALFVHVRVGVRLAVVLVLMLVLDVLVVVIGVGVLVGLAVVLVRVRVRVIVGVVAVLVHAAPSLFDVVCVGVGGLSAAPALRCSMWRRASSSRLATCES